MKPIADALPKIEEKIKDLTGDKKTAALAKLDELKKSLSDFKTIDAAKMGEAKDKLLKAFDELKKMVGL
jgi:hypothetical protein